MTPLLVALFGLGVMNAANSEVRRFERAAATDFASLVRGEEKQVHVQAKVGPEAIFGEVHAVNIRASRFETEGLPLFVEPERSTKGRIGTLRFDLEDFVLTGLSVRRLSAEIPDCRFDFSYAMRRKKVRLSRSGEGAAEVEIGEKELERFVLAKYPQLRRCVLKIDRDKVIVERTARIGFLTSEFWAAARLEPAAGTQFVLNHARILLNGRPADDASRDLLLKTLNPVIDLDKDLKLHGAVTVERIILRDGTLRGMGRVRFPVRPKE